MQSVERGDILCCCSSLVVIVVHSRAGFEYYGLHKCLLNTPSCSVPDFETCVGGRRALFFHAYLFSWKSKYRCEQGRLQEFLRGGGEDVEERDNELLSLTLFAIAWKRRNNIKFHRNYNDGDNFFHFLVL